MKSERVAGIEPAIESWEDPLMPLQHTRALSILRRGPDLQPAKVPRGLPPMTVDAPHVTFFDLGSHSRPTLARHHAADVRELVPLISVVELEHDDVVDVAVDAGMRSEVAQNLTPILNTPRVHLSDRAPDV